ncbi:MAG: hypothetical protein MUP82_06165 [Candidatus Marinimicrobia bacterium]|nr:hypothetical protein [Candidatus Neomarinimicrobiota bacterium]
MVLFKINGERNSGTNFLEQILSKNNFPTYSQQITGKTVYHWKHGVPCVDYKELDEKVVDLFIFKRLEDWLISFSVNPYHLKKYDNFKNFLTLQQISNETQLLDYRTNKPLNEDDNGKTIFQIREYKFNKIMEYKKNNKDVILVNLSFIQNNNNLSQFLAFLSDKYMKTLKVNNYICNIKHTKDNTNNKNRTYNIDINKYRDIVDSNKNEEIENFINSLSFI